MLIILLVLFVVSMFLWLLTLLGQGPSPATYAPWLAWFAVLTLGIAVFVSGMKLMDRFQ